MSANKKIYFLLIILLFIICVYNVEAAVCRDGLEYKYCVNSTSNGTSKIGTKEVPIKKINKDSDKDDVDDKKQVYCSQFSLVAPNLGCDKKQRLSAKVAAGVYEILDSEQSYVCKEIIIAKFLYIYGSTTTGRTNYNLTSGKYKDCEGQSVYNTAKAAYDKIKALEDGDKKITFSPTSLNFKLNGNNFVATTTITVPSGYTFGECSVDIGSVSKSGNTVTVSVPKKNIGTKVTLSCSLKASYGQVWSYSDCEGYDDNAAIVDGQNLVRKSSTTTLTKSFTISGTTPSKGDIQIIKKNSVTGNGISGVTFDIYNGNGCTGKAVKTVETGTDGTVTHSGLAQGNYSIKETVPSGYVAPSNTCTNVTVSAGDASTKTITNTPQGGLKITKTNSSNDVLAQLNESTTAKFKLYNNSSCSGTAIRDFNAGDTVSNLDPGTYYLKEYQAKTGYHLPQSGEKWYCDAVTITAGNTKEIKVENKTECEYKFKSEMTMPERIDLYNLIKTNYSQEFNALLDMNKITAKDACQNIPITKSYTKGCFSAQSSSDYSNNFSETNVSMYTEKYGQYTFCLTKYNMTNSLGKTSFNNIKTGQTIIKTDNVVATATLNRVCHNFGDTNITNEEYNNLTYSNYIEEDASIDGTKLIKNQVASGEIDNKTITVTYTLPVMYASNKDGKIHYGSCPSGEYCKVLGRGIISKFNLNPGTYNLNFDISLKEEKLGNRGTTSDCSYTVENELIDYNNRLNIEFRSVNTNSDALFLSKYGTNNRKAGANWSSEEDRDFVLKEKNNSYNKNNEEPLYSITITPEMAKKIRQNNKSKTYDDYNMTCVEDGTICISNYLTCLQNENNLFIKQRKNINNFNVNQIVCEY